MTSRLTQTHPIVTLSRGGHWNRIMFLLIVGNLVKF